MKLEHLKVNFLGDSITEGHGVAEAENIFLNRLKNRYHWDAARNYGIGGTRIARQSSEVNAGWKSDYCARALQMDDDADLIVVFGGTNDYGHGDASLGDFYDRTVNTFYGACHVLMQELLEKYTGKPIVFMTPLHRLGEESHFGDGSKEGHPGATLQQYVDAIKEVAAYYSLPVIDLWLMSGLQPAVPAIQKNFVPDGLHPNDAGHAIMADRIAGFLEAL